MGRVPGRLVIGERVVYRRIVAAFDDPAVSLERTGFFEVVEGMAAFLSTVHPYRLALDGGRREEVYISGARPSGSGDVTDFGFRLSTGRGD
jgi:hypothetical protein